MQNRSERPAPAKWKAGTEQHQRGLAGRGGQKGPRCGGGAAPCSPKKKRRATHFPTASGGGGFRVYREIILPPQRLLPALGWLAGWLGNAPPLSCVTSFTAELGKRKQPQLYGGGVWRQKRCAWRLAAPASGKLVRAAAEFRRRGSSSGGFRLCSCGQDFSE